jgi:hypothetical protein
MRMLCTATVANVPKEMDAELPTRPLRCAWLEKWRAP